jgi:hypothetical protein
LWRYLDLGDYAQAVLRDAPLDEGKIEVTLVEHVPHLHTLQHLQDAWLLLLDSGRVDDLAFLRNVPSVTTSLLVHARAVLERVGVGASACRGSHAADSGAAAA